MSFDGKDDYVEVPDSSSLDITDAITIEGWMKFNSVKTHTLLMKNGAYGLRIHNNDLGVSFWDSNGIHNIYSDSLTQEVDKW